MNATATRRFIRTTSLWEASQRFHGYFLMVAGTALTRLLAFAAAVVLARYLGPERFGEVAVFLTFIGFWSSADFLDSTFVRYAAETDAEEDRKRHLRAVFHLKLAWNLVLLTLAFPVAWALSEVVFQKPVLFPAILFSILCGLGLNLLSLRAAVFQARERFLPFAAMTSLFYVVSFILVLAVAAGSAARDTTLVYGAYLAAAAIVGAYGVITLLRLTRGLRADRAIRRKVLEFSRWLFGANLSYMFAQRLDLFLLTGFASLAAVGQYGAALRVAVIVSLLTGTLAPVLLPRASRTRQSPELMRSYLKHAATLSGGIAVLVVALWLAAPAVVKTMFGDAYADAVPIVRIILIGTLCIAVYTPLSQLFFAERDPRKMLYLSLLRLGMVLGLGLMLVPVHGGQGAALAVACAEVAALMYVVTTLRKQLRLASGGPQRECLGAGR